MVLVMITIELIIKLFVLMLMKRIFMIFLERIFNPSYIEKRLFEGLMSHNNRKELLIDCLERNWSNRSYLFKWTRN